MIMVRFDKERAQQYLNALATDGPVVQPGKDWKGNDMLAGKMRAGSSGGAFTPAAQQFLQDVANERLEKPFDVQELRALVNRLV